MGEQKEGRFVSDTILSIENITKTYSGVVALNNISLSFKRGAIHAIAGENGAGKSTLIKVISGFTSPDQGQFTFNGYSFSHITPRKAKEMGVAVIYQEFNLVPDLSVAENVFMGNFMGNGLIIDKSGMEKRAKEIFEQLGVQIDLREKVKNLSTAQMQFVEIAKAVSQDLKLLVMDEPTASLTSKDVQILFKLIARLKEQGITIIYISHRLNEIYELSDQLTIMRDGKIIITAGTKDIPREELIRLMVGRQLSDAYPPRPAVRGEILLQINGLSGNGVRDISFSLRKGEILGFAGLIGSGRTETVRMLFGADRKSAGEIILYGEKAEITSPQKAVKLGIGFLPEDRKIHGVLLGLSIQENISLPIIKRISRFLLINRKEEETIVRKFMDTLHIAAPSVKQVAQYLSGGNQQKVVVSKWLASSSKILIFDEPTRGIDVGAKYEIYQMMNRLSEQGVAIIMISSEMEELIGMADRIIVLHEGRVSGMLDDQSQFTQERIMELASKADEEGANYVC